MAARRRGRPAAAAVLMLACALAGSGCERLPTAPARFGAPVRGITFVDWSAGGYATPAAATSLGALTATGANSVVLIVTAYQAGRSASTLGAADPRTPTPAAVRQTLESARALGLEVALKPHVDLEDGSWRGRIEPIDPEAWFRSYRSFILPWAALAESVGAARFVLGTELAGTIRYPDRWSETIRAVRAVFSGELVYAASWDEAARVPFWRELDLVGVDCYVPVAARRDPGRLEVLAAWQPWLERLRLLHRQTGRRVLITEIGYRSVDGAGMQPYRFDDSEPADPVEQADLYWAAMQATGEQAWIAGLYWWYWPADGSGGPERDYTPRAKPAADELRGAWTVPLP